MAENMVPQSRAEEILIATINGTEYTVAPQSRLEYLLLELKDVIEEGSGGGSVHFVVVEELPTTDIDQTAIYLVPKSTAATSNVYDEYINTDGTTSGWELIGSTDIDLSDYITDDDLATVLEDYATTQDLSGKQDTLTAGDYIKFDNDEVSVQRWAIPAGDVIYKVITGTHDPSYNPDVERYTSDGQFIDSRRVPVDMWGSYTLDDMIRFDCGYTNITATLLVASHEQAAGQWFTLADARTQSEHSCTFTLAQEENDNDLIIREELDVVSSAVSAIKDGQTIDSFADVETALTDKADKSAVKNEFIGTTAEWNALTTAQKKAYDTYQITDDYTEGSGGLPDYSTTEQKTGQKWIDNKDVYFKVVTGFSATLVANAVVDTGVDISSISKLIDVTALGSDDISVIPVAGYKINNTLQLYAYQSGNVINNAIIYYTKTA